MKKSVLILATVCLAAICLSACDLTGGNRKDDDAADDLPDHQTDVQDEYAALNKMVKMEYSRIVLTVTDTIDQDLSLTSVYEIAYEEDRVTVDYTVERLAEFGGPEGVLPGAKKTLTGEAVILDGKLSSVTGDDVGITPSAVTLGFTFKKEYFENAELTGMYFTADVKEPTAFLGAEISCTGMKLTATYFDAFYKIEISYTSAEGNEIKYNYQFEE